MSTDTIINNNFSKNAKTYDSYSNVQQICAEHTLNMINGDEYLNILDIGCGTGLYTNMLINRFSSANIDAIDISPQMISAAKAKLAGSKTVFMEVDADRFYSDSKYDLITSNSS